MKATENFSKVISAYIEREKQADPLFAKCVEEQPKKTVDGCVNFILKEVKDSGVAGWTDDEIFGMAKHFFDEHDLKDPGALKRVRVVVNHHVELSDEEKQTAKDKALKEYQEKELNKLKAKALREKQQAVKRKQEKHERESKMQLDLFGV